VTHEALNPIVEGLMVLAKAKAQEEFANRSSQPRGLRRRYPRTKNFFVLKGLNYVFVPDKVARFKLPPGAPGIQGDSRSAFPGDL
jgi:hypothetical protein